MAEEFQVTWQRAGQPKKRALYQTREGAQECVRRQETARDEMTWLSKPLPEIVYGPVLRVREVGEWQVTRRRDG